MAAVKGKGRRTTLAVAAERAGISADYYQELQDTFKLYDTDSTGTLSVRKLRLAMRTLGFEASAKDIDQIIQETSMLSVHSRRRKQAEQQSKRERSLANGQDQSKSKGRPQRKSTRATAIAAALDSQSKYVELDSEGEDKEGLGGDDSDPNDDFYKDTGARERQHPSVDDDLYFTFDDFVLIMAPNEGQHASDEAARVFSLFDTQDKGVIGLEDLRRVAGELGIPMKDQELREMIEEASRDGDGVTQQAFSKIMKKCGL